jgi:hypothetical protein
MTVDDIPFQTSNSKRHTNYKIKTKQDAILVATSPHNYPPKIPENG